VRMMAAELVSISDVRAPRIGQNSLTITAAYNDCRPRRSDPLSVITLSGLAADAPESWMQALEKDAVNSSFGWVVEAECCSGNLGNHTLKYALV
jgi:hypothetical protein